MVCVLLREIVSPLTFIFASYQCQFHSMISDKFVCFYLQTWKYRGNEKYVLVLVQCHDGMITNSINLICVLHSSWTSARLNRFISSHHDTGLEPEPNNHTVYLNSIYIFSHLFFFCRWVLETIKKRAAHATVPVHRASAVTPSVREPNQHIQ